MEQTKKYGRLTKELMFQELKKLFDTNEHFFMVGAEKLAAHEIESLRRLLRQEAAKYVLVKNALCHRLLKEKSLDGAVSLVQGQTAVVFGKGDPSGIAKSIVQFAKNHEFFKINGAVLAGQQMDSAHIKTLASLPSRQVLIAKTVGGMKAPIVGLVFSLSGLLRQLVVVLDGVKKKKS
jgi:large subunit ribosomal protein L10